MLRPDKVAVAQGGHAGHGVAVLRQDGLQRLQGAVPLHVDLGRHVGLGFIGDGAVLLLDLHHQRLVLRQHDILQGQLQRARQKLGGVELGHAVEAALRGQVLHLHLILGDGGAVLLRRLALPEGQLQPGAALVVIYNMVLGKEIPHAGQDHQHQRNGAQYLPGVSLTSIAAVSSG